MCGIAGVVAPDAPHRREALGRMLRAIAHRGPDEEGVIAFDGCILGHRRLSIVDLVSGGQPMEDPNRKTAITFNGEIYGFRDIRRSADWHLFRTTSDTEVILALYEKYELEFLEHLPGMFAFALWDARRRRLVCARDRFGEKPFYYAVSERGAFVFASEIKAIVASGLVKPRVSRESLAHFLCKRYVASGSTIYRNVHSLPPAHLLVLQHGKYQLKRYWNLPSKNEEPARPTDVVEEFRHRLDTAVKRQLVADVEVGTLLSGGLDSTTIVASAARHDQGIKTFSFGFQDNQSELPYARAAARMYGTDHHEEHEDAFDLGALLEKMVDVYDEPFADSSNIPTYLICRRARKYGKVVLTGDGGDELFGGYFWYRPLVHLANGHGILPPKGILRPLLAAARRLGLSRTCAVLSWMYCLRATESTIGVLELHDAQNRFFSDNDLNELGLGDCAGCRSGTKGGDVDDAMRQDLVDYMPGDILAKIDRASMAHGLELRAPFLDVDFASFCIALPASFKVTRWGDKQILRRAYSDSWPRMIRNRPKEGFGAPVHRWVQRQSLRELTSEILQRRSSKIYTFLPYDRVQPHLGNPDRLWILLVLGLWCERNSYWLT